MSEHVLYPCSFYKSQYLYDPVSEGHPQSSLVIPYPIFKTSISPEDSLILSLENIMKSLQSVQYLHLRLKFTSF